MMSDADGGNGGGGGGGDDDDYSAPAPSPGISCFSGENSVMILDNDATTVKMKDLKVGDLVFTAAGRYEKVYAFGHYHRELETTFLQLHTHSNLMPLEVTPEHMVYLAWEQHPVSAASVRVGDYLKLVQAQSISNINSSSVPSQVASSGVVTKITTVQRTGIYAPLTADSSTLVVNGVAASNFINAQPKNPTGYLALNSRQYPETGSDITVNHEHIYLLPLSHHDGMHYAMRPFRWWCTTFNCEVSNYNEEGMPHYVANALELAAWVDRQHPVLQAALVLVFVIFHEISSI